MWSQETTSGKVKYTERYEHPLTGKQHYVSVTMDKDTKSNRKLAMSALQDKIDSKIGSLLIQTKKHDITLSDLVNLYRKDQESTVKKSTYTRNVHATQSLMAILGEDVIVERLTAGYVRECLAAKNEEPGTTNERITRFKALIRWGYRNDYISDIQWLDKLQKFKDDKKAQKLEEKFLESDELKLLLENMSVDKWRMLCKFTALSGLRVGEAIALKSSSVDFKNRYIYVRSTYDMQNEIEETTKTPASDRDVYMQDELFDLCKQIQRYMRKEKLKYGYQTDLFMSNINGGHLDYYAYNKYLKENAQRLFNKDVTTHFLRHTHVALMAEQGVSLEVISRRLGHTNSKITREIYFHVTKKMRERDNQQIKNVQIL
jgi:integrase